VFAVLSAALSGAYPAAIVEHFPVRIRVTGIALGYNTGCVIFDGTAPLIATLLIKETGSKVTPSFYAHPSFFRLSL
jgi:MHS family proline/betaine transporter-like MFS transporter